MTKAIKHFLISVIDVCKVSKLKSIISDIISASESYAAAFITGYAN
jgi:hypothetical protein